MPENLTWLHLSDAHLGDPSHAPDAEHVLQTLTRDLTAMQHERGLRPDLIFFTGDAAFGEVPEAPLEQQFAEVAKFLDGVRHAFHPHIEKQHIFIVPGNHDVNRGQATEDQQAWLENLTANGTSPAHKIDALMRTADVQWQRYMERLESYAEFLRMHGYGHLLADAKRLSYAIELERHGRSIGIAGFNTAWSCGAGSAKGHIWLGRWQLLTACAKIRKCDLRIALSHHPFNWLSEHEDPAVGREVAQSFHYHLHGHEHDEWVTEQPGHTRIAAGACYDSMSKLNGYNMVSMDLRSGIAEVHLRGYNRQGHGWVPRCIHDRTSDRGIWTTRTRAPTERLAIQKAGDDELNASLPGPSPCSARAIDAYDYFSPASEIEDAERFIGRRSELQRAVGALRSRGASMVIFGHAGLGKTSLAFQIAHVASGQQRDHLAKLNLTTLVPPGGFRHPVIYHCCQRKDRTIDDVLTAVIRDSHPPFSTRALLTCKRVTAELRLPENAELAAQLASLRSQAADGDTDTSEHKPTAVVPIFAAFASLISRAFEGTSLVVILDEFNVVADTSGMAALVKELHFVTFVLVGTAVDVRMLVRDHASVSRQLAEGLIRVKEMGADDLKEIIRREEARAHAAFRFDASAMLEVVNIASGMPCFVHLIGRYALATALTRRRAPESADDIVVTASDVRAALNEGAEHMGDLDAEYLALVRKSWKREFVLKLLAIREETEVPLSNITPAARSQGVPDIRGQVNYFVRKQVLEQTAGSMFRFRDQRLRVFARLRPAVHDDSHRRLSFIRSELMHDLLEPRGGSDLPGVRAQSSGAVVRRRAQTRR